jgi:hypothetical protein
MCCQKALQNNSIYSDYTQVVLLLYTLTPSILGYCAVEQFEKFLVINNYSDKTANNVVPSSKLGL